jgi:hypothetical protein
MKAGMKVGSLVRASRDKYVGPGTLAFVIDMVHGPRGTSGGMLVGGTSVCILVDGKAIWVSASMLEVVQ